MPKRWVVGGIWAVVMSAELLVFAQYAEAEQPAPMRRILIGNVMFRGNQAQEILISDVVVCGNHRISLEQIKSHLRTRSGEKYRPDVVDEDIRELYKTGQFSNIAIWQQPDGADRVKIYFGVREMPNLVQKVAFRGAKHIKLEDLQEITGVRPSTPLNPHLNRQGCQKIMEKYAEQGRSFAECKLIKGGDLADTEVVYQITEGPKVKVHDIQLTGNRFASDAQLKQKIALSAGSTYNRKTAETGIDELYSFYGDAGYRDVRIALEIRREPTPSEITMIYHIHEGPRARNADKSPE